MCGVIALSGTGASEAQLSSMLESIRHRGPDDAGIFVSRAGDCGLGHVRLSILDLSAAGHQPMVDSSGRYVIAYNGEVYNFRELRKEIDRSHGALHWRSDSDTEVILQGFALEGAEFLRRLNGIFALAIYDTECHELHVLRDPLGVKPLFVTETAAGTAFSSELKGLLRMPGVDSRLRLMSIAEQMAFMYVPEPNTLYSAVRKVEPGVLTTWRYGKCVSSTRLFDHLLDPLDSRDDHEWVNSFRDSLSLAVRRQLVSDAPVSIMLSGGLDSSAIAWEAVQGGANFRHAYTIAYSQEDMQYDRQSNDLHYARRVAEDLGLKLEVIRAEKGMLQLLPELAQFLDDGVSDPAGLNTYLISRAARENGVKVLLTGQGADEYLAGYRRYRAQEMLLRSSRMQEFLLRVACAILPRNVPGRLNSVVRRVRRMGYLMSQAPEKRLVGLFTWADQDTIAGLFADALQGRIGEELVELFKRNLQFGHLEALLRVDQAYDLRSLNLTYCDRLSMAAGVEARVPFLDFDLVRLMNSIPPHLKLHQTDGKYVLKKAMEGRLPEEIIHREKAGFGLPLRSWLRQDTGLISRYLGADDLRIQGIFNPESVNRLCRGQFSGSEDNANVIFALLCFQLWLKSAPVAAVS